jgi:hypothetical protein
MLSPLYMILLFLVLVSVFFGVMAATLTVYHAARKGMKNSGE